MLQMNKIILHSLSLLNYLPVDQSAVAFLTDSEHIKYGGKWTTSVTFGLVNNCFSSWNLLLERV